MSSYLSHKKKMLIAGAIWLCGLIIFIGLGIWNYKISKQDADNRLVAQAGHVAARLSSMVAMPGVELDYISANALVNLAMDDDQVYAVKVETRNGIREGQRRNDLWEPIPWDDELTDECVQGMNPLKYHGQIYGKVEVWLSPRLGNEENSLLLQRELWRIGITSLLWTLAFIVLFWQTGELRRLGKIISRPSPENEKDRNGAEAVVRGLNEKRKNSDGCDLPVIDPVRGRLHQKLDHEAWNVTAGMFHQTFARGPALINRLYAGGETAGLCHLGRILEQAAPCIGAEKLKNAAHAMQQALNDPQCQSTAVPVEECARALEEVLDALCGDGQWRSRPGKTRS